MIPARLFWWLPSWYQTLYWARTHWLVVRRSQVRHGGVVVSVAYEWEHKSTLKFKTTDSRQH